MDQDRQRTGARAVANFLVARGVHRIFGLVGGHTQPIWDELAQQNVEIVDTRHECGAVYMAHAQAALSGGLAVVLVTAGPGLSNAMTGIANAHIARTPLLIISARTPRPQAGRGGMQDLPQAAMVAPLCRRTEAVSHTAHILPALDACVRAALGADGPSGPAYIDFPTDLLREPVPDANYDRRLLMPWHLSALQPRAHDILAAADLLRAATRILVIGGKGAQNCGEALPGFLEATGAVYIDTSESRGSLRLAHPAAVPAMRARALAEADLIVTLGRKLDFQLAYGSPAVFAADAKFLRIGRTADETSDNRRDVEINADLKPALEALLNLGAKPVSLDTAWRKELVDANAARGAKLVQSIRQMPLGKDGRMHPYTLIAALNEIITDDTIVVADGGDILSFARVALKVPGLYLDPGSLGCIGTGVSFAVGAALFAPDRRIVGLVGDGSFGFLGIEISTAVRKKAPMVLVVANNEAWNIDRHDQIRDYGGRIVGVDLPYCRYGDFARSLGAHGERVEDAADLPGALTRALANMPAVVEVMVSQTPTSPDFESGLSVVYPHHALRKWNEAEEDAMLRCDTK